MFHCCLKNKSENLDNLSIKNKKEKLKENQKIYIQKIYNEFIESPDNISSMEFKLSYSELQEFGFNPQKRSFKFNFKQIQKDPNVKFNVHDNIDNTFSIIISIKMN